MDVGPAGSRPEHSLYSPMLECPCTDRKPKKITQHNTVEKGVCDTRLDSTGDCFTAVEALGLMPMVKNVTVESATTLEGCYVMSTKDGYEAFYNSEPSKAQCGPTHAGPLRSTGASASSGVDESIALDASAGACPGYTPSLSFF